MSLSINNSQNFYIHELTLVTKRGNISIVNLFEELNLYDCIFLPVTSGKILITDAVNLYGKLSFDGSEHLVVDIAKSKDSEMGRFKKKYRIYKVTDKKNVTLNSQRYILHFVSDELIYSDQQKINQSYENTYSEIIKKILKDYLKVENDDLSGYFNDSMGIRKTVIPNLSPLDAIQFCTKCAVDKNNSPNFLFFQNAVGFNFASLSTLLPNKEIMDIKFQIKNTKDGNPITDMCHARSLEHVTQVDIMDKIRSGVDAGKAMGFDPMTRMTGKDLSKSVGYGDHFDSMKHGNDNPSSSVIENRDKTYNMNSFDSKQTLNITGASRQYSEYIKKREPASFTFNDDTENYKLQRLAIMQNLINKRLRAVMPGNFQLTSGLNVNLIAPNFGIKETGANNEDTSLNGKYLIVATRHVIGYNKYNTLIEIASSSTDEKTENVSYSKIQEGMIA